MLNSAAAHGEAKGVETLLEAVLREFEEETGIRLAPEALRPLARIVSPLSRRRLYAYVAAFDGGPEAVRLGEGAGFGFFALEAFAGLDLVPTGRLLLAAWAAEAGRAGRAA